MSKLSQNADVSKHPNVPQLFGTPEPERRIRRALYDAMKRSPLGLLEISQRMTAMLGREVTVSMLREFTRSGLKKRAFRFPLAWTPALCEAIGDWSVLREVLPENMRAALEAAEHVTEARKQLTRALAALDAVATPQSSQGRK